MESILARALESTLKYWLNSFSREQFKLQGRTVQLSNLDINGDALHASAGFPPALEVTQAKVGKLEIKLPSVSNVQTEPIVVQIDRLDLVLTEKSDVDTSASQPRNNSNNQARGGGYGFADKIADGMTLEVQTVNLMLETHGSIKGQGGATWTPPLASITIRKLLLYTTNENWKIVNLKEAREFSNNKKFIYIFKKLEWESISVDLLPHPDMFSDEHLSSLNPGENKRDDDGAKRMFFGGERFLDNLSGQAYITIQRTEQNIPLGLEVQLHISEVVCPALSEPGLRALLRFLTGLYVCMNRGDLGPITQQHSTAAASCSLVAVVVDHIFLGIKDAEFQLELLMQALHFSRASVSDGEITKTLSRIVVGSFFLRDTFSQLHCTLVQPLVLDVHIEPHPIPNFANEKSWPRIFPLEVPDWQIYDGSSMVSLYSLQINPSPAPPVFASQTVVLCQPIKINLQEESCLRIMSFLADGIVVNPGDILPDTSVNYFYFSLKELNLSVPLNSAKLDERFNDNDSSFTGARLHIASFIFAQSPSVAFKLLSLEKDPACFTLWKGQPIDSSQRKWVMRATQVNISLETENDGKLAHGLVNGASGLWHCIELHEPCIEGAMVTPDGSPLVMLPPPGGVVRMGVACKKFISNTSVEQFFFVLKLYAYLGKVGEEISKTQGAKELRVNSMQRKNSIDVSKTGAMSSLVETAPSDTAVLLSVGDLHLKFLETVSCETGLHVSPLVQLSGSSLNVKVSHRTLGGAMVISSDICWKSIQVDCIQTDIGNLSSYKQDDDFNFSSPGSLLPSRYNSVVTAENPKMHAILWIDSSKTFSDPNGQTKLHVNSDSMPFLEVNVVHVLPYKVQDAECHSLCVTTRIAGVRLGGGMNYNEALLHRFGILGPDGGPGEGLRNGLHSLSRGPLAKLFKGSPHSNSTQTEASVLRDSDSDPSFELTSPDDIKIDIKLQDWLFALEGIEDVMEGFGSQTSPKSSMLRERNSWHMAFQCIHFCADSGKKVYRVATEGENLCKTHPVELIKVGVEKIQILKPGITNFTSQKHRGSYYADQFHSEGADYRDLNGNGSIQNNESKLNISSNNGGVDFDVQMRISEDNATLGMGEWIIESVRLAVKDPTEMEATKEELQYLMHLSKSEIEALSRITVGLLQVLQLQDSLGQAAMDQLNNIGSGSLDRVVTPSKARRHSSSFYMHSNLTNEKSNDIKDDSLNLLGQSLSDSQDLCSTLKRKIVHSEGTGSTESCTTDLEALSRHLEKMQIHLLKLRSEF